MSTTQRHGHGGNIYAAVRDCGGRFSDFLDYSANINPLGLSETVRRAILDAMDSVTAYPDPDATGLKEAISDCYRVPAEGIETGNGAVELIYLLCRALSPRRVLLPAPTFGEYGAAARAAGLHVAEIPLREETGFVPSPDELARELRPDDLLFVCNPNNPTGAILKRERWEPLISRAAAVGAHVTFDESFMDFRPSAAEETCRSLIGRHPCLTVLHSLTKFLAVPGLRLGFLLGSAGLVERMRSLRDPWNVNVMAQAAGVAGLADQEYRRRTVELITREKDALRAGLESIPGIRTFPPAVNFILTDLRQTGWDAPSLQAALLPHRVLVRNCANFGGLSDRHVRVAVKTAADNGRFVELLKSIMLGADARC